ncbi:collagen, type I, alpha 1a-like [Pithys albifrons albifrons]|uniref:collagen, type I, alpha 1a-like n=1 Tax=Pithys albifrons albifrons TaxID=3385563 RepID=UPI003A5CEDDA
MPRNQTPNQGAAGCGDAAGILSRANVTAGREPSGQSRAVRRERAAVPARDPAEDRKGQRDGRRRRCGTVALGREGKGRLPLPGARRCGRPARAQPPGARGGTGAPRAVNGGSRSGAGAGRAGTVRAPCGVRDAAAAPPPPANQRGPAPETRGAGFESGPVHAARRRGGGGRERDRCVRRLRGGLPRPAVPGGGNRLRAVGRDLPARGAGPGSGGRAVGPQGRPVPPPGRRSGRRPGARVTHCLQTNASGRAPAATAAPEPRVLARARAAAPVPLRRLRHGGDPADMPCRPGERFLLLERPVAVGQTGSKEVDALVAKLGEVLQLSAQRAPPPARAPKHLGPGSARDRAAPYSPRCCSGGGAGLLAPRGPVPPQAHPQHAENPRPDRSGHQRVTKQLCGRGWLRSAARRRKQQPPGPGDGSAEEEDPHRLLQQLILSGNLIKEAVRRLQLAAAAAAAAASAGSSGSASAGSGGADGEAAAGQPLQ